jgi:hypothetical protein
MRLPCLDARVGILFLCIPNILRLICTNAVFHLKVQNRYLLTRFVFTRTIGITPAT